MARDGMLAGSSCLKIANATNAKHNAKHNCLKRVPPLKVPHPRKLALKWILLLVGCVSRF